MTPQHHLPADIERTSISIITRELDGLAALIEELWFDGPKAEPSGQDLGSAWAQIESAGGQ